MPLCMIAPPLAAEIMSDSPLQSNMKLGAALGEAAAKEDRANSRTRFGDGQHGHLVAKESTIRDSVSVLGSPHT